jgi:hypothetical protein
VFQFQEAKKKKKYKMKSIPFVFCTIIIVIVFTSLVSSQEEDGDMATLMKQREQAERQIIELARSKIGEKMKPQHLINYVLNPKKNIDRFAIEDHLKMQENNSGLFVVDKRAEHIGIMNIDAIIHASKKNDYVVKEESIDEAKKSFPNGWKRVGPDGVLKMKYSFQQQMNDILKQASGGSAAGKAQYAGSTAGKNVEPPCPDCVKNKKNSGDL